MDYTEVEVSSLVETNASTLLDRILRLYYDLRDVIAVPDILKLHLVPQNLFKIPVAPLGREVYLRSKTGDLSTLREVFCRGTYSIPDSLNPLIENLGEIGVIDLGGNIGLASIYIHSQLNKLNVRNRIVAVEPESGNFEVMELNLHGIGKCINAAIAPELCRVNIIGDGGRRTALFQTSISSIGNIPGYPMQQIIQDNGLDNVPLIVKCDIEGGEVPLLTRGNVDWLDKTFLLFVEDHSTVLPDADFSGCNEVLLKKGFRLHPNYHGANPGDKLYVNQSFLE